MLNCGMGKRFLHFIQQNLSSGLVISFRPSSLHTCKGAILKRHNRSRECLQQSSLVPGVVVWPLRDRGNWPTLLRHPCQKPGEAHKSYLSEEIVKGSSYRELRTNDQK